MSELLFGSATETADLLRRRRVSSRELTAQLLSHITAVNPTLGAVVELRHDEALREAIEADEALARGGDVGPLQGIPMTVKESFAVAGMHSTWGNRAFADHVSTGDATAVGRLRRAGAIVVGTTNVHEMLADFGQTANEVYGRTNNPWDTSRSPGGSTGGGAAALSAGMTFLEYGSDLVGSIRIPASFCGVYGLKPTAGTVSVAGFQPPGPRAPESELAYLSTIGPLARTAGDLRTALRATAGSEGYAGRPGTWELAPPRRSRLEDHRVGIVLDHSSAPVASDVGAVLSDTADALAKAGVSIIEGWPTDVDPVASAESFGFQVGLFFAFQGQGGADLPMSQVIEQERRRMATRAAWGRHFRDVDVFLCPTTFTTAFPHDDRPFGVRTITTPEGERPYDTQPFWISHASLAGLPAVSAPVGSTAGRLPVGIQVVGPLHEDDTAITFSELMADVVGGYTRPPSP